MKMLQLQRQASDLDCAETDAQRLLQKLDEIGQSMPAALVSRALDLIIEARLGAGPELLIRPMKTEMRRDSASR